MKTKLVKVTPKLAAQWLATNHSNRPVSRAFVDELSRSLRSGTFQTTHQGIAFDEQGRLRDGQHRLTAIVETGITIELLVTTGLTDQELLAIDDGRRRTIHQVLTMVDAGASFFSSAITKEMLIGGHHLATRSKPVKPGRQELIEFFNAHAPAIGFAEKLFGKPSSGFQIGYIGAVIARAWYSADRERLEHFATVLVTGFPKPGDESIIRLRNHLLKARREKIRNRGFRDEIYAKTQRTLTDWLAGVESHKLESTREELFAIPPLSRELTPE